MAQEQPSLHLTVTIVCRNAVRFCSWLAEELAQDPELRRDLPLQLYGGDASGKFEQVMDVIRDRAIEILSRSDLAQSYRRKSFAAACLKVARKPRI